MSELLTYQYQAREKQIDIIKDAADTTLAIEIEYSGPSFNAFKALFFAPPLFLPEIIRRTSGNEEAFFEAATPAAILASKREFVLSVLERLLVACGSDNRGYKEVAVDLLQFSLSSPFQTAFHNHQDILETLTNQGKIAGRAQLLSVLEGPVGLLMYRRDLVEGRVELDRTKDGGEVGSLATKVDGVNLKLWYPRNEKLPKASLTVDDLKEVTQ